MRFRARGPSRRARRPPRCPPSPGLRTLSRSRSSASSRRGRGHGPRPGVEAPGCDLGGAVPAHEQPGLAARAANAIRGARLGRPSQAAGRRGSSSRRAAGGVEVHAAVAAELGDVRKAAQPTTTFPFGSICALPMNGALSRFGCAPRASEPRHAVPPVERDQQSPGVRATGGAALLSKMLIMRPSAWWRASCCHANACPGPIWKSDRLPPRRQSTFPVSLCTL